MQSDVTVHQAQPGYRASANESSSPGTRWRFKIVAFLCNNCSYAGADLAGTIRSEYPATVRVIRLPCVGRVDPIFVLHALQRGASGVLISGCHPGECRYQHGNLYARRRIAMLRALFEFIGIDPRRVQMSWVSASEGHKWAGVVTELSNEIAALGPLRLGDVADPLQCRADVG